MQSRSTVHTPSLLLLIMSAIGLVGMLGLAAFMFISGYASESPDFLTPSAMVLCGLLLIPACYYSWRRLQGHESAPVALPVIRGRQVLVAIVLWIPLIILAGWLGNMPALGWLVLPPLFLITIALPVIILLWSGVGGLPIGSRQRAWGIFGVGMICGPLLSIIIEGLTYAFFFLIAAFILFLRPEWMAEAQQVLIQMQAASTMEDIITIAGPYLLNPVIIVAIFLIAAILTPLTEELVKPFGVWLMRKHINTPQEGFALGALSGGGFALVEAFLAATGNSSGLGLLLVVRAFASMMHILTTALTSRGIVQSRQQKKIMPLIGGYGMAVLMHGLWNGSVVFVIYGALRAGVFDTINVSTVLGGSFVLAGLAILLLLVVGGTIALPLVNGQLRKTLPSVVPAVPVPETGIIAQPSALDGQNGPGTQTD